MSQNIKNSMDGIDENSTDDDLGLEEQIVILNKKISDLIEENEVLQQNIDSLKSQQEYVVVLESKIYQLNKKISELEQENMNLYEGERKLNPNQEYIENLENKIIEYDEKIASLEKINRLHRETIDKLRDGQSSIVSDLENKIKEQNEYVASLITENREIRKQLEHPKEEQIPSHIEENIINLQKKIASLEKQNKDLEEKNQVLKAALLLHVDMETTELTDTAIKPISKKLSEEAANQKEITIKSQPITDITEKIEIDKEEHIPQIPKGKVQELVNQRHVALMAREYSEEKPQVTQEPITENVIVVESDALPPPQEKFIEKTAPEAVNSQDIEDIGVIETSEGRRKCPICGNENLRLIREVEDKTKIISAYPRLYGKKLKCGQCGAEWR